MKCCCLCLWFNHPAPSWLNFASSGSRQETSGGSGRPETRGGGATPARGWASGPPAPLPEVTGGEMPCVGCGFRFCCTGIGCFWAGGGGSVLLSSCMFCSAALQYRINARKGARKASLAPPQINCHIPKLSSSPWSVLFLLAGTVI